jgi:serine carboxypeptidase-like clade 2
MIDRQTHDGVLATCNMSDVGPLAAASRGVRLEADWEVEAGVVPGSKVRPLGFSPLYDAARGGAKVHGGLDCDGWTNQAFNSLGNINIYDIFVDVCGSGAASKKALSPLGEESNNNAGCATNYDPCRDDKTTAYLNNAAVKAAIHANASIAWSGCSSIINYSRFDLLTSMLPVYEFLFSAGLRIMVFSVSLRTPSHKPQKRKTTLTPRPQLYPGEQGDVDAIVPVLGTRAWLEELPLTQTNASRPWTLGGQVGGWVTEYKELTFATVRNAGHMVPETQGARGLALVNAFLSGAPLPS